jgi:hypothetical protein
MFDDMLISGIFDNSYINFWDLWWQLC